MGINAMGWRRSAAPFIAGLSLAVVGAFAVQSLAAGAAGSNSDESSFVSIEPCRLADTRPTENIGPNTTFGANDTTTFQATGTNGQCSIPSDAVGLSLNVTAVNATMSTYVTVWPDGDKPNASSLNPEPGQVAFNAVTTPLSATGSFLVYNLQGNVDVIIDVNGYYTKTALSDLDDRLDALETLTASMSLVSDDYTGLPYLRFTGVNVQVVSGSGATNGPTNGTGNLIVGYNERKICPRCDWRTGSHNLVIGDAHAWSGFGGLVAGYDNSISGAGASVTGGFLNVASGGATVSGGTENNAAGAGASVSGGYKNLAEGYDASVSGGWSNRAAGDFASVSGGRQRVASSDYNWVAGSLFEAD